MTNLAILVACIILVLLGWLALTILIKQFIRWRFLRTARPDDAVYLTFDDGPDPEITPRVLDVLEKAGAQATFFVMGRKALAHPEVVRAMVEKGHAVGSHGFDHLHAWRVSPQATWRDLRRGHAKVGELLPRGTNLLRPPFGKFSVPGGLWVLSAGLHVAFWDLDPRDYEMDSAQALAERILAQVRPGSVVLLHDGHRREGRDLDVLVKALQLVVPELTARGLRMAALV